MGISILTASASGALDPAHNSSDLLTPTSHGRKSMDFSRGLRSLSSGTKWVFGSLKRLGSKREHGSAPLRREGSSPGAHFSYDSDSDPLGY